MPYFREDSLTQCVHCFRGGPSDQILDIFVPVLLDAGEKPVEASLNWKPSAHKCRDRGSNAGLIGAKQGKIHVRCPNLHPRVVISQSD